MFNNKDMLITALCTRYTIEEIADMYLEATQTVQELTDDLLVMRTENKAFSMINTDLKFIINNLTEKH